MKHVYKTGWLLTIALFVPPSFCQDSATSEPTNINGVCKDGKAVSFSPDPRIDISCEGKMVKLFDACGKDNPLQSVDGETIGNYLILCMVWRAEEAKKKADADEKKRIEDWTRANMPPL
jgi:hypothetical protein